MAERGPKAATEQSRAEQSRTEQKHKAGPVEPVMRLNGKLYGQESDAVSSGALDQTGGGVGRALGGAGLWVVVEHQTRLKLKMLVVSA